MDTGIDVFDSTIQKSNRWIKELMEELHTEDKNFAYTALRSVLHALRDRLPKEETIHLAAQLPMLITGLFYDGWKFKEKPRKWNRAEFYKHIRDLGRFNPQAQDPERMILAVFRVLERHVTAGEIGDIVHVLPKDLKGLWLSAAQPALS